MFEQGRLLEQLGDPFTNRVVDRLHRFAYIPPPILESLARNALSEHWGRNNYVLSKYLAVHIAWSIEQRRFTHNEKQLYVTAGHLQTRYGTPLYLVFAENPRAGTAPWRLITVGSYIAASELPVPPDIPEPPGIPIGAEIVMMHDHILGENAERVPFLSQTPPVAQMCSVSGAIQWSIN